MAISRKLSENPSVAVEPPAPHLLKTVAATDNHLSLMLRICKSLKVKSGRRAQLTAARRVKTKSKAMHAASFKQAGASTVNIVDH